ncbi:putative bifunctional diguanylate cyclase/phosphodiesterase [Pseudidiomarina aestuarii]|nr:EAL domain-containing protein [Pseudidiomarina aestuarii]
MGSDKSTEESQRSDAEIADDILKRVAEAQRLVGHNEYFVELMRILAASLQVDHAMVAEVLPDQHTATTKALVSYGKPVANFTYNLDGSPCEQVLDRDHCAFPNEVCERFPRDEVLQEIQAQSYLGVPMFDQAGFRLGLIALLHSEPRKFSQFEQGLVAIIAALAGAELAQSHSYSELKESRRRLETLIDNLPGVAYRCKNDEYWTMEFISSGVSALTGYTAKDFLGNRTLSWMDIIYPPDRSLVDKRVETKKERQKPFQLSYRIIRKDGQVRWVWEQGQAVSGTDQSYGYLEGFITDITERQEQRDKITKIAFTDTLTGLPNRAALLSHLHYNANEPEANKEAMYVAIIDVVNFRRINDEWGIHLGDEVLKQLADRISESMRANEYCARLSADEFVLVVHNTETDEPIEAVLERVLSCAKNPIRADHIEVQIALRAGVVHTSMIDTTNELLQSASTALHQAKLNGQQVCVFSQKLAAQLQQHRHRTDRFMRALAQHELTIYFQPQIDLRTNQLIGAEVLCRWIDDELGMVPPDEFIAIAAEQGVLNQLGEQVMGLACDYLRQWQESYAQVVKISVNLAVQQLDSHELVEKLVQFRGELPQQLITLEITESALMTDPEQAMRMIHELRQSGFRFAVDDFGTGYSSLAYLQSFEVDILKIDMSFVHKMIDDGSSAAIVSTIIAMAQTLGMKTIAEGVETEAQAEALLEAGCTSAQGYFFAKPMPADEFAKQWLSHLNAN